MRSWRSGFVRVCAVFSLCGLAAAQEATVVLLSANPKSPWPAIAAEAGWRLMQPDISKLPAPPWTDAGLKTVAPWATGRAFLIAEGELAPAAFYAASRMPDAWIATVAVGGSPRAAIATTRLYAANTRLTPVLWISDQAEARLARAGFQVEVRASATGEAAIEWLRARQRDEFPAEVDCETGNPQFARCFWVEMTGFDARRRNDVLDSTRVWAGSGAYLDVGGFGFKSDAPGPGVFVEWLPDKYSGPLRVGDRIVAIAGKEIRDAHEYVSFMEQQTDARPAAVMVQRQKDRTRIESRIVVPPREELVTARAKAQFLPEAREILLITRQVSALRVKVPEQWEGAGASWNGQELGKLEAGCWDVDDRGARKCP